MVLTNGNGLKFVSTLTGKQSYTWEDLPGSISAVAGCPKAKIFAYAPRTALRDPTGASAFSVASTLPFFAPHAVLPFCACWRQTLPFSKSDGML